MSDIPFPEVVGSELESSSRTTSIGTTQPVGRRAKPLLDAPDKERDTSKPQSKPPTVDEWQDFIGRIVLHSLMEAYVSWVLRDIELTEAEAESIRLTKQDYKEMSAPLATFTAKNDWAKKHGREVIGAADSIEALVALSIWMRRVHKIARRHRPEQQAAHMHRRAPRRPAPQVTTQEQPQVAPQTPVARPETFTRPSGEELARMAQTHLDQQPSPLYERVAANGSSGASTGEGIRKPNLPGTYGGGFVGNPGTG